MRGTGILCLLVLVLSGCGASTGNWVVESKGEAWNELSNADNVRVAPVSICPRGEKELRPDNWQTVWPGEFAGRFSEMMNAADVGVTARTEGNAALVVKLKLDPFYNGNGYSAFGSNPASGTAHATIETKDGRKVATLRTEERKSDYMGGGPWKAILGDMGETFAGWMAAQRK